MQFLIPVWNDLLSLVLCLPSVLSVADEVVFYDDASTDGSAEYIRAVAATVGRPQITCLSGGRQQGWTDARTALMAHADASMLRVWADADDLVVPSLWESFTGRLAHEGCLGLGFYEVWGDHRHTTRYGLRGDVCHLALWPGDTRLTGWDRNSHGHTVPLTSEPPTRWGPMCAFHLNGYKTDERLAVKGERLREFNRARGQLAAPRLPESHHLHPTAMRVLFTSREHQPAVMPHHWSGYLEDRIPPRLRYRVRLSDREGDEDVTAYLRVLRDQDFAPLLPAVREAAAGIEPVTGR